MDFLVSVPTGLLHDNHKDYVDPADMARVLRSHIAHMGNITIKPIHPLIPQLKTYLERSHDHYSQLNQTSKDNATIAYAGHKADILFEILSTLSQLEGE